MSDLYDTDIVQWSQQQAELLRRRAAGELVNDADLDWPNIAEEIESVGNEQRHAVEIAAYQHRAAPVADHGMAGGGSSIALATRNRRLVGAG